ncbi:MAG: ABC transporter ATP-binding protein, partial [Candidatus Bathyarchaeia archaeon]
MNIKTVNLTRIFQVGSNNVVAVKNVNLEIKEASFVSIVGPSGSGKTTLLNLLGLNDTPTHGKIFFDEKDMTQISDKERRRIRLFHIGFVFQNFNLLSTLTSLENVELPLMLAGKTPKEQRERALRLLELVGLKDRKDHFPNKLSMGEMQRVAIARALANDPKLVIADEPTGELDSVTGREIIELLYNLCKDRKVTVVVATHDERITKVSDVIFKMQDGEII